MQRMVREERIRLSGNALLGLGHSLLDLLTNVGSSEGARKGWETRRRNGWRSQAEIDKLRPRKDDANHDYDQRLRPADWQVHPPSVDARRRGNEAAKTIGRILSRHLRNEVAAHATAEASAPEITAAFSGRKPLYHDIYGEASLDVAEALQDVAPPGVTVRAIGDSVIAYRADVARKILDSDPTFYRPNREDDHAAIERAVRAGMRWGDP